MLELVADFVLGALAMAAVLNTDLVIFYAAYLYFAVRDRLDRDK